MSDIYDGRRVVISDEKELYIPLPRERRHELVVPGPMNCRSPFSELSPVRRSHEQYFTNQIKEKQQPAVDGSTAGCWMIQS